jgi:hypothetical protein
MSKNDLVLRRGQETHIIDREIWAETLLLAERYGWKPPQLRMKYLRTDFTVSAEESDGISRALQSLFDMALRDPLKVYPIRPDMGRLYEVKDFVENGAFDVHVPAWHR